MNKLVSLIKKMLDNRKVKNDFKSSIFGGIEVVIKGDNLNKVYSMQEYESISRFGPYLDPVRAIKQDVYDWCLKVKGMVRVADEYRTGYCSESFYFSREKDAKEFQRIFNIM